MVEELPVLSSIPTTSLKKLLTTVDEQVRHDITRAGSRIKNDGVIM